MRATRLLMVAVPLVLACSLVQAQDKKELPKLKRTPKERTDLLKKADAEAMELIRAGRRADGAVELTKAAAPYTYVPSELCSPEESRALATIYLRIATILNRDPRSKTDKDRISLIENYLAAAKEHAQRGGLKDNEYDKWFDRTVIETNTAWTEKK